MVWFRSGPVSELICELCPVQVNEIYQDQSLGANINVVLVNIVMLSPSKVPNCRLSPHIHVSVVKGLGL